MSMSRLLCLMLLLPLLPACAPVIVAGAATGVAVAHDRRTVGAIVDDQNIELKVAAALTDDADLRHQTHIGVTSVNGIVLLTGEAETTELRDRVLQIVRDTNGVRRITNEIRIAAPSLLSSRSLDVLITSAIKSRYLVTKDLDPSRVKVVTEDGTVYLMGLVTRAEGDLAADRAATIDGVERVVKIFEYLN
jgi:osmotically-inducible protein OsmY